MKLALLSATSLISLNAFAVECKVQLRGYECIKGMEDCSLGRGPMYQQPLKTIKKDVSSVGECRDLAWAGKKLIDDELNKKVMRAKRGTYVHVYNYAQYE